MKHLLPFLFLCLMAFAGIAQPASPAAKAHILTIFAEHGEKFFLILDGEKINNKPMARVTAPNLEKGYYRAKVIFDDERLPDYNGTVQLEGVDPGFNDVTYILKKKTKKGKVSYKLWPGSWKSLSPVDSTPKQVVQPTDLQPDHTHLDNPQPVTIPVVTPKRQVLVNPVQPVQPQVMPCNTALPQETFQGMLSAVEAANFEDIKLQTANIISDGNCLTTGQIKQVIKTFNFEESRLAFAKTAYSRCLDKQNYLQVNDAFQFSSSKSALNEYILSQKK